MATAAAAAGCHWSLKGLPRETEVGDTKGNEGTEGVDEQTGSVLKIPKEIKRKMSWRLRGSEGFLLLCNCVHLRNVNIN